VIMAEGLFSMFESKTAACVIRYRPDEVVAVIDSTKAGRTAGEVLGFGGDIPVVSSLEESLARRPTALLIGIAPRGGDLPAEWRPVIATAISEGLDILSGLHYFISDDDEFASSALRKGVEIHDLRKVPPDIGVSKCRAGNAGGYVVLTVGTDCNVGKMTASVELASEARRRGHDAVMLASGQTGIYLEGAGIAVDRAVADYIAGAAERLVLEADAPGRWLIVEGQGALTHPAYSGVALGILHGTMPDCMVLCHQATRTKTSGYGIALPGLKEVIGLHERLAAYLKPAKVVAIALNCCDLDDAGAARACREAKSETGLPAADPIRHGAGAIVEALELYLKQHGRSRTC
jgi:uncharacterized NAD-dependent epimerase/dehydratase family protein